MWEKRKNGLVDTVNFFDDSVKKLRGVNEWTSQGIALWELNIENGLFSTHFKAFISTQVFDVIWISRLSLEKQKSLSFVCAILSQNIKKDKLSCQFDLVKNFDACVESLCKMFLNVSRIFFLNLRRVKSR